MIIRKYFFYLLIFLFSCTSKNSNNFLILKQAFISWYDKNHITNNFSYEYSYFNVINNLLSEDYIEDINRFKLELSQINKNSLNSTNRTDFEILTKIIHKLYFDNINSSKNDLTVNIVLSNIYNSFYLLMNDKKNTEFQKIFILKHHLSEVSKYLNNSKNKLKSSNDKLSLNEFNSNFKTLLNYLDLVASNLNINDENYKDLNDNFNQLLTELNKYNNWVNYDFSFSTDIYYNNNKKNNYDLYIDNLFDNKYYDYNKTISYLKNKIKILQNDLFNESLSIYLNFNDEPIWVDKSDTLNVLKWVIDNKIYSDSFKDVDIVENISNEYKNITNYYKSLNISNFDTTLALIKYRDTHEIISDEYINGIYILHDKLDKTNFNKYYAKNLIFEKIFSMHNIYGSLSNNINDLRNIENKYYSSGISLFLFDLYANNINKDISLNKISFNLGLLRNIEIVLIHSEYKNNLDHNIVSRKIKEKAYLFENESNYLLGNFFEDDIYFIESLLTYFHLLQLYEKQVLLDEKLNKKEFIEKIFNNGYVNYYTIK